MIIAGGRILRFSLRVSCLHEIQLCLYSNIIYSLQINKIKHPFFVLLWLYVVIVPSFVNFAYRHGTGERLLVMMENLAARLGEGSIFAGSLCGRFIQFYWSLYLSV